METKVYQKLAGIIDARINCLKVDNPTWISKHEETIESIVTDCLPSGSGIDSGCQIDLDASHGNKLVIHSSYHAMDDNGMYDRWYDFTVKVTPNLHFGFDLKITGKFGRYQHVKDYLYDLFDSALNEECY